MLHSGCVSAQCHRRAWSQSYDHRPSRPYSARAEYTGFSPTRPALLACTKRETKREVFGESHEG